MKPVFLKLADNQSQHGHIDDRQVWLGITAVQVHPSIGHHGENGVVLPHRAGVRIGRRLPIDFCQARWGQVRAERHQSLYIGRRGHGLLRGHVQVGLLLFSSLIIQ